MMLYFGTFKHNVRPPTGNIFIVYMITLCSAIASGKGLTTYIDVNGDGSIANTLLLPKCDKMESIDLQFYKYLSRKCTPGLSCLTVREGNLSTAAQMVIHKSCSLKDACENLQFPVIDIQQSGYNAVLIQYQCLDQFSFFDICTDTKGTFNQTVHLVSNESTANLKACGCFVAGEFSLTLNAISLRGRSTNTETCSLAKLLIADVDYKSFSCSNTSESYGTVFQQIFDKNMSRAAVSLETDPDGVRPEMIWLSLQSKKPLTVSCKTIKSKSKITSTLPWPESTNTKETETYSRNADENISLASRPSHTTVLIIGVACPVIAVSVCWVLFWRGYLKSLCRCIQRVVSSTFDIITRKKSRRENAQLSTSDEETGKLSAPAVETHSDANTNQPAKNVYARIYASRKNTLEGTESEDQYDTTLIRNNVAAAGSTYDHLPTRSGSKSVSKCPNGVI